jgi:hypothetical protein
MRQTDQDQMSPRSQHLRSNGLDLVEDELRPDSGSSGVIQPTPDAGPIAKLAECDRHLASIGLEVESLQQDLARLRAEAEERDGLLGERDVAIAELGGLLPTLEAERVRARREAHAASVELDRAKVELSEQAQKTAALERALDELRAHVEDRNRTISELEGDLAHTGARLEESRQALVDAELRASAAEPARRELESVSTERDRLLVTIHDERERARRQAEDAAEALLHAEERAQRESTRAAALERELMSFGFALAQRVGRLAELEAGLSDTESRDPAPSQFSPRAAETSEPRRTGHVRFILEPGGYKLVDADSAPPAQGDRVEVDGRGYVAVKIARSPVSGDERPCVYLLEEPSFDDHPARSLPDPVEAAGPSETAFGEAPGSSAPGGIESSLY